MYQSGSSSRRRIGREAQNERVHDRRPRASSACFDALHLLPCVKKVISASIVLERAYTFAVSGSVRRAAARCGRAPACSLTLLHDVGVALVELR